MTEANAAANSPAAIPPIETSANNTPSQQTSATPNQETTLPSLGIDLGDLGLSPTSQSTPSSADPDSDVVEMGLDDDSVKGYDFEFYKGRKGFTDRISIINPNSIYAARAHYIPNAGYVLCHSKFTKQAGQEVMSHQAKCCEKYDNPRKRFAALIVQYSTNPDGSIPQHFGFTLKAWQFTEDKYVLIRNVHKEYPLNLHDIKVTCTEEKWQRLTIQNCRECLWRHERFPQQLKDQIELFVKTMGPKVAKRIGKKKTEQELLEVLGLATAPSTVGSELPLTDLNALLPSNS